MSEWSFPPQFIVPVVTGKYMKSSSLVTLVLHLLSATYFPSWTWRKRQEQSDWSELKQHMAQSGMPVWRPLISASPCAVICSISLTQSRDIWSCRSGAQPRELRNVMELSSSCSSDEPPKGLSQGQAVHAPKALPSRCTLTAYGFSSLTGLESIIICVVLSYAPDEHVSLLIVCVLVIRSV